MPSLVESLGAELRRIGTDLPLAELTHAAERLRTATALSAYVMHESGHADWVERLAMAGEHLDAAIAATAAVVSGLDEYLASIGLTGIDRQEVKPMASAARPGGASDNGRPDPVLALRTWWAERVDLLAGRPPAEERPETVKADGAQRRVAPEEPTDALRRLADTARDERPDSYREALLATHPASGMQVASPAARALRYLGTDLLGHPPGPDDAKALANRCRAARVRELLPRADEKLGPALVGQVCGVTDGPAWHPVDVAAAWPVLIAEALRALGKNSDALAPLVATPVPDERDFDTWQRLAGERERREQRVRDGR